MCVCRLLLRHCQTSLPRYVNSNRRLYALPHSQLTADICSQHAWRQMQDCPSMEPRRPMSFYGTSLQRLHLRCCRAPSATTGAMAQTAAGQPPGVPGTQTVRTQGNPQLVAPLQSDPVGPASKLFPHPFISACLCSGVQSCGRRTESWRHIWGAEGSWRMQMLLQDQAGVPQTLRRVRRGAGPHSPLEPCCTAWHPDRGLPKLVAFYLIQLYTYMQY